MHVSNNIGHHIGLRSFQVAGLLFEPDMRLPKGLFTQMRSRLLLDAFQETIMHTIALGTVGSN